MIELRGKSRLLNEERLTGFILFVLSLLWFYFPAEYVLVANQDLSLFIPDSAYLISYLDRPGGLLEYLGDFLNQFYRFRFSGATVLSLVFTGAFFATLSLAKRFSGKKAPLIAGAWAFVLLMGMHNYYPHQLSHSLGFILCIALAAGKPSDKKQARRYLALIIPMLYWVSGGFLWFFCLLVLTGILTGRDKLDLISLVLLLLYPALIFLAGLQFIYLHPLKELLGAQLPFGPQYGQSLWPGLFVAWMLLILILASRRIDLKKLNRLWKRGIEIMLCLLLMAVVLHFSFNRKNADFFAIEKRAVHEDWDGLLSYVQDHPSTNLFGSFYTNLALVNKGILCEDLFHYPQGFGRGALCFGWEEKEEILRRGSDFFWTINFVNEAHHWAFESMVIEGFTRRNLERLIQCELVRGNFKVAEKYIHQLGRALFQKKLADHYARFLYKQEAIRQDLKLGPRWQPVMTQDFFAEGADLEKNLISVLYNRPSNGPAMDYLMALYLLEKEVEKIPPLLPGYLESHEGRMPSLLDESLLVYQITHREDARSELSASQATFQRFEDYTKILRQYRNPEEAARMLYPDYKHTFWFHLNFNTIPKQ